MEHDMNRYSKLWGAMYDFSLDWQMNMVPKEELKKKFQEFNISFIEFKKLAQTWGFWVPSMEDLNG